MAADRRAGKKGNRKLTANFIATENYLLNKENNAFQRKLKYSGTDIPHRRFRIKRE